MANLDANAFESGLARPLERFQETMADPAHEAEIDYLANLQSRENEAFLQDRQLALRAELGTFPSRPTEAEPDRRSLWKSRKFQRLAHVLIGRCKNVWFCYF